VKYALLAIAIATLPSSAHAQSAEPSSASAGKPLPGVLFTDITKIKADKEQNNFLPSILKSLPSELWLDVSTDTNQRLETNILQTQHHPVPDYIFRAQPSIDLGYNLQHTKSSSTAIYTNYQLVKDVYAGHSSLTFPTNQLLGFGIYRRFKVGYFNWVQLDCQARENWQAVNVRQANLLPALYLTRIKKPNDPVWFGSVILQMVSALPLEGATQEIDPAYSVGVSKQLGGWACQLSDTFITNFRHPPFKGSTPNNQQMIAELDVSRSLKKWPLVSKYLTMQSVWNCGAGNAPGISGYDLRVFTGLRYGFSKRPYMKMKEPQNSP